MSNDELARIVETSDEWIYSHTGIHYRHIAAENEAASDLGVAAADQALERAELPPEEVDLVLVATSTPDYPGLPSTASVVQDRIGAINAGAMDLVAACTGFIYGLETARAYVLSGGARNVLVVGSEVYSKILNWKDRNTCVLFGDGAGAVLVTSEELGGAGKVVDSVLRSRGSGAEALFRPSGGSRRPLATSGCRVEDTYLQMQGRRVYTFAVQVVVDTINELLERNRLTMDDVDHVVPHQANARIIEAACKRGGFPREKFFLNIAEYANTSAASIPIALDEMIRKDLLHRGERVITVGFGAGLAYGGNYLIW
jgi:3-oxoacyl-[acyl-carrier-protein] synthase-3